MSITGQQGEERADEVGVAVVDVLTGLFATTGILAALHHPVSGPRSGAEGGGQPALQSLLGTTRQPGVDLRHDRAPCRRAMGNRHPSIAPYEVPPRRRTGR